MPKFTQEQILPYPPKLLYQIIMDIEAYPDFLPWVRSAKILEAREEHMQAELEIGAGIWRGSYISQIEHRQDINGAYSINVVAEKGIFDYLVTNWLIIPAEEGAKVKFLIDFEIKSKILGKVMGSMLTIATQKMVQAFELRAKELNR